jgi:hypothetical protein
MLGESNAEDLTESIVSRFLRFGERESNDEIDLVGLVGSDARALGNDGGRVFR